MVVSVKYFAEIIRDGLLMKDSKPMLFYKGDKVICYEDDLLQKTRIGTIIHYLGHDKNGWHYRVEFANRVVSTVSDRWIRPYEPPVMDDTRSYLETLNDFTMKDPHTG